MKPIVKIWVVFAPDLPVTTIWRAAFDQIAQAFPFKHWSFGESGLTARGEA